MRCRSTSRASSRDVGGQRVVAAAQEGERLAAEDQVDRRARAGAEGHVPGQVGQPDRGRVAGRGGQPDGVLDDLRVDVDGVGRALEPAQRLGVDAPAAGGSGARDHPLDDDVLLGRAWGSRRAP